MTEDHEKQQVFGIVCKWKESDKVDVHTSSTIIEYSYHGSTEDAIKKIYDTVNPLNIIRSSFRDRINLEGIEVLDKFIYLCNPINEVCNKDGELILDFSNNTSRFDTSFVMPHEVKKEE